MSHLPLRAVLRYFAGALLAMACVAGHAARAEEPRFEFTRLVAHWAEYNHPDYLPFLFEAQPDVVQLGEYGAHFWNLAHTPQFGGYPSHFPVQGLEESGAWFEQKNKEIQSKGMKVVGHFNVEFIVGDPDGPEGPRGFFKFYRDLWDEKSLGPKPVADPMTMMEHGPDGKPISQDGYGIGGMKEYWACLRNPHWQQAMKAWVKNGIRRGVDGYVVNYFYRHNCLCEHCQNGFRAHLKESFKPDELKGKFGIDDLATYKFTELPYWYDPAAGSPLKLESLRYSQISNKQVFDEVFVRYGRSLKADLIVAQWNHLGNFGQIAGDERCVLPGDLWGKDETYLWYSTGDYAARSDLEKRFLGDATLQCRYIRGAFDDKPYTLGKYESTRTRMAIAELAANGGAPMGFYTRFTDPEARREIVRYYQFMKRYDDLYRGNLPYAEAVLLYPRSQVHQGNIEPVETFRQMGRKLLDEHVLFDVLPDDLATPAALAQYGFVFTTANPDQAGGELPSGRSRFTAPYTVRVSASRPKKDAAGNAIDLHFVNYNREEPPKSNGEPSYGGGIKDEKPIAVRDLKADFAVPKGFRVKGVSAFTPEQPEPATLPFEPKDGRVLFTMPEFLVYGVARLTLEKIE